MHVEFSTPWPYVLSVPVLLTNYRYFTVVYLVATDTLSLPVESVVRLRNQSRAHDWHFIDGWCPARLYYDFGCTNNYELPVEFKK